VDDRNYTFDMDYLFLVGACVETTISADIIFCYDLRCIHLLFIINQAELAHFISFLALA
jgi:hypothetical protein